MSNKADKKDSFKKLMVSYLEYIIEKKEEDNKYTKYILEKLKEIEVDEEHGSDIEKFSNLLGECVGSTIEANEKLAEAINKIYRDDIQRDIKISIVLNIDKLNPS